ncbi:Transforming acidic coiled-coil-containing protein 3 [Geodia barretti]|nr:Transforming acidic coiled-coil-containing protein 3 [Geodia barretti]
MVDSASHHQSADRPLPTDTMPHPSDAPPTHSSSGDDFRYMNEFSDQDFQGSAAQFDIGYLENIANKNPSHVSALTRESLYVKFDPLVAGGQSSSHKSPHIPRAHRDPHLTSNDLMAVDTPPRNQPASVDLLTSSPARLPTTQMSDFPSQPAHPPPSSLSTSFTLSTSPRPSGLSPRSRPSPSATASGRGGGGGTGTLVEVLKYGEEDMAAVVEQTRLEERAKHEAQVQLLKEELSRKEAAAQRRVERVQKECQAVRSELKSHVSDKQRILDELEQLRELLKTNESTQEILHSHYDDLRAKVKDIEQQREVAIRDFEGLDKSFADLHQRYLRLKQSSDSQQQQEKALKSQIAQLEESCLHSEEKLRQLQADATQQMNDFNSRHGSTKKQHAQDVALTKATVRKLEFQVETLNRALEEKAREKEGLTQLCDELLAQINPS